MTVADRVLERRTALGMTQTELAIKMGYKGKTSVSKIETAGDNITLKTIEKLAAALNTTHAYLLGWVDSPLPDAIPKASSDEKILTRLAIEIEDNPEGPLAEMVRIFVKLEEHEQKLIFDLAKSLANKKEEH